MKKKEKTEKGTNYDLNFRKVNLINYGFVYGRIEVLEIHWSLQKFFEVELDLRFKAWLVLTDNDKFINTMESN